MEFISIGRDFAVFRGKNGVIDVVSAVCPCSETNMAIDDTALANCIECLFYGCSSVCISGLYSRTTKNNVVLIPILSEDFSLFFKWQIRTI